MNKYFLTLLWVTSSGSVHADQPQAEHFEDILPHTTYDQESHRAIQTAFLNNLLVIGNTNIQGNLIVDGTITNSQAIPDMCGTVTGPNPSTQNAIARYANTSGNLLANSGVFIDSSNNVTGVKNLPTTTLTTSISAAIGGPFISQGLIYKTAIEAPALNDTDSFSAAAGTSIVIIKHATPGDPILGNTITFPPSPTIGQLFTLINGDSANINALTLTSDASISNPIPNLTSGTNQTATYIFYGGNWFLISN